MTQFQLSFYVILALVKHVQCKRCLQQQKNLRVAAHTNNKSFLPSKLFKFLSYSATRWINPCSWHRNLLIPSCSTCSPVLKNWIQTLHGMAVTNFTAQECKAGHISWTVLFCCHQKSLWKAYICWWRFQCKGPFGLHPACRKWMRTCQAWAD